MVLLRTSKSPRNPRYIPPKDKCALDILPPEILAYIFELGTRMTEGSDGEDVVEEDDGDEEFEDVDSDDEIDEDVLVSFPPGVSNITDDGESNDNGDKNLSLPFQVRISHVCRRWRAIALDTPGLWTHLTFDDNTNDFERSSEWIRRSKSLPLDIEIDALLPEDAMFDPDNDDQPDKELSEKIAADMKRAQELLAPVVIRWRSFKLSVSLYEHMTLVLDALAQCSSAPMLETLHLYCHGENEDADFEEFNPPHLRKHYTLFNGLMPKLKDIVFWGVHVDWSMFIPTAERDVQKLSSAPAFTTNLTKVELGYHTLDVRPSLEVFMNILRCAPRLDTLALSCSGPLMPSPDAFVEPLALPTLKSLRLAFLDLDHALILANVLYVPDLNRIELEFEGDDYTPLLDVLLQPMKSPSSFFTPLSVSSITSPNSLPTPSFGSSARHPSMLAGITEAKLSGMPCADGSAKSFYESCPNLRRLHLNMTFMPLAFFTALMDPNVHIVRREAAGGRTVESAPISIPQNSTTYPASAVYADGTASSGDAGSRSTSTIDSTHGSSYEVTCSEQSHLAPVPLLESLTISGISGDNLKTFVLKRRALGCRLKELMIDEGDCPDIVKQHEFRWLKKHVETVEWVEISDDEDVDDETEASDEDEDSLDGSDDDGDEEGEEEEEEDEEDDIERRLAQDLAHEDNWTADELVSWLTSGSSQVEVRRTEARGTDDSEWETEPEDGG